jgi:predicted metal-dependent enzyme (double-stranded beta helix superfamily)
MTRLLYSLLLLLAVAVTSAQESYPHAFPREGAKQLIDNARVTVWDVTWLNGVKHPIHRHRYDMAGVYLRWGPITVTRPDGTVNPQNPAWDVPRLLFQRADVTHREEALNPPETPQRLAIMTDLKYPANETRPPLSTDQSLPHSFPRPGAKVMEEHERVRFWDYAWTPGATVSRHVHDTDTVEVFLEGGEIESTTPDGTSTRYKASYRSVRFVPRGTVDTEMATGRPRAVVVELK